MPSPSWYKTTLTPKAQGTLCMKGQMTVKSRGPGNLLWESISWIWPGRYIHNTSATCLTGPGELCPHVEINYKVQHTSFSHLLMICTVCCIHAVFKLPFKLCVSAFLPHDLEISLQCFGIVLHNLFLNSHHSIPCHFQLLLCLISGNQPLFRLTYPLLTVIVIRPPHLRIVNFFLDWHL